MDRAVSDVVTSSDGTQIAYERSGEGPAVILIDGASAFRGFGPMDELAKRLAPGFTVITYDRRGRGGSSDRAPYAIDREIDDVEALIRMAGGSASLHGFSSGAVLALRAAARGLPIRRLTLLEPPLAVEGPPPAGGLAERIRELVEAGRRGDAVEHFQRGIGVPEEMIAAGRRSPAWPVLEGIAPTLAYDAAITADGVRGLEEITTPSLVLASRASDERLRGWAEDVAGALPNASLRLVEGGWHGVDADRLAPVLAEFLAAG